MKVKAAPGLTCPMEKRPRKYITDAQVVEVPNTAYYARLVSDGSLVRIDGSEEEEVTDGQ